MSVEPIASLTGLGVDIVEIEHLEQILERSPRFREKVFSQEERDYCDSKARPGVHYALRFAAKEAVLKALGTGFSDGIKVTDVEVTHDDKGRPIPVLHGRAAQIAEEQGILEIHLSLSRTSGTAVANAIAATEKSKVKPPEEKPDPKQELANTFKELRGMLDEMEYEEGTKAPRDQDNPGQVDSPSVSETEADDEPSD